MDDEVLCLRTLIVPPTSAIRSWLENRHRAGTSILIGLFYKFHRYFLPRSPWNSWMRAPRVAPSFTHRLRDSHAFLVASLRAAQIPLREDFSGDLEFRAIHKGSKFYPLLYRSSCVTIAAVNHGIHKVFTFRVPRGIAMLPLCASRVWTMYVRSLSSPFTECFVSFS